MSNLSSGNSSNSSDEEAYDGSTTTTTVHHQEQVSLPNKKRRKLPGNPDPNADVIALSPKTLMAKNRFICEVCNKGFQREQNLQLHRRGHNLPWKLKQKSTSSNEIVKKRVYICPEPSCIHHNPARALGDLTGIKKHYSRKHGEKNWKCDKCSKKYAVQSDWKAHSKTCGTKEYKCDCGTIFSRRDSFVTHRAFCDALTEENNKVNQNTLASTSTGSHEIKNSNMITQSTPPNRPLNNMAGGDSMFATTPRNLSSPVFQFNSSSSNMSATALLQQAAQMGSTMSSSMMNSPLIMQKGYQQQHTLCNPTNFINIGMTMQVPFQNGFIGPMLQNGTDQETFSELLVDSNTTTNTGDHQINHSTIGNDSFMTLDFLGIGRNFDQQQQQQQEMSFEQQKTGQQDIQGLSSVLDI